MCWFGNPLVFELARSMGEQQPVHDVELRAINFFVIFGLHRHREAFADQLRLAASQPVGKTIRNLLGLGEIGASVSSRIRDGGAVNQVEMKYSHWGQSRFRRGRSSAFA